MKLFKMFGASIFTLLLASVYSKNAYGGDPEAINQSFKDLFMRLETSTNKSDNASTLAALSLSSMLSAVFIEGNAKQAKETVDLIRKASDLNISCAQFAMSQIYWNGVKSLDKKTIKVDIVVAIDKEVSTQYLMKSAENGCPDGQFDLGLAYFNGEGVLENDKLAVKWFEKAAYNGKADAMVHMELLSAQGKGIKKDSLKALAWAIVAEVFVDQMSTEKIKLAHKEIKIMLKKKLSQKQVEMAQHLAINLKNRIEKNRLDFRG